MALAIVTLCSVGATALNAYAAEIRNLIHSIGGDPISDNAFDYALFNGADDSVFCMNANSVKVQGDIHSGGGFVYRGNEIEVEGTIESGNDCLTISVSDPEYESKIGKTHTYTNPVELPQIVPEIRDEIREDATVYSGYTSFQNTILSGNAIVNGDVGIYSSTCNVKNSVIVANGSIQMGLDYLSASNEGSLFLCSENGNIQINASNSKLKGILYAPNGYVMITGDLNLQGRIIAKQIYYYGSNLTVTASEDDLTALDCLSEVTDPVITGEKEGRENHRINLSLNDNAWISKVKDKNITWSVKDAETGDILSEDEEYFILPGDSKKEIGIVFRAQGDYVAEASIRHKKKEYTAIQTLHVFSDLLPVSDFMADDYFLRDENKVSSVSVTDLSYSADGDELGIRTYEIWYDNKGNGTYEEPVTSVQTADETATLALNQVGQYKITETVSEILDPEVQTLYEEKGINISEIKPVSVSEKYFEIGNRAPKAEADVCINEQPKLIVICKTEEEKTTLTDAVNSVLDSLTEAGFTPNIEYNVLNGIGDDTVENAIRSMYEKYNLETESLYLIGDFDYSDILSNKGCANAEKALTESGGAIIPVHDSLSTNLILSAILSDQQESQSTDIIIAGQNLKYSGSYLDYENDPLYQTRYTYSYKPYDENGNVTVTEDGQESIVEESESAREQIGVPGEYHISVKVQDNPVGDNDALESYRLWSEEFIIKNSIPVVKRPTFDAVVTKDLQENGAYTIDVAVKENNALTLNCSIKEVGTGAWEDLSNQTVLSVDKLYLLKAVVEDKNGVQSLPKVYVIENNAEENAVECRVDRTIPTEVFLLTTEDYEGKESYADVLRGLSDHYAEGFLFGTHLYESAGHFYYAPLDALLWNDAKEACEKMGGHLVTISSQTENDFVRDVIREEGRAGYLTLGFSDAEEERNWKWVTGEEVTFTAWNAGEPNNGLWMGAQNHAFMLENGEWDDGWLNPQLYMCEWDSEEEYYAGILKYVKETFAYENSAKVIVTNLNEDTPFKSNVIKAYFEKAIYESGAEIIRITNGADEDSLSLVAEEVKRILAEEKNDNETAPFTVGDLLDVTLVNFDEDASKYSVSYQMGYQSFDGDITKTGISDEWIIPELPGKYRVKVQLMNNVTGEMIVTQDCDFMLYDVPKAEYQMPGEIERIQGDDEHCIAKVYVNTYADRYHGTEGNGIESAVYKWKKAGESTWTEGMWPDTWELENVYLLYTAVKDIDGVESAPSVYVLSTKNLPIEDKHGPSITIIFSNHYPVAGENVTITFQAVDESSVENAELYILGEQVLSETGTYVYETKDSGEIVVSARAIDEKGNVSTRSEVLKVLPASVYDVTPPEVAITRVEKDSQNPDMLRIYGTVTDETKLSEYKLYYSKEGETDTKVIASGSKEVTDELLGSLSLNGLGEESFVITLYAKDAAGNEGMATNSFIRSTLGVEFTDVVLSEDGKVLSVYGSVKEGAGLAELTLQCVRSISAEDEVYTENEEIAVIRENLEDGVLCMIDTALLVTGEYILNVKVRDIDGNEVEGFVVFTYTEGEIVEEATIEKNEITPFVWTGVEEAGKQYLAVFGMPGNQQYVFSCVDENGNEITLKTREEVESGSTASSDEEEDVVDEDNTPDDEKEPNPQEIDTETKDEQEEESKEPSEESPEESPEVFSEEFPEGSADEQIVEDAEPESEPIEEGTSSESSDRAGFDYEEEEGLIYRYLDMNSLESGTYTVVAVAVDYPELVSSLTFRFVKGGEITTETETTHSAPEITQIELNENKTALNIRGNVNHNEEAELSVSCIRKDAEETNIIEITPSEEEGILGQISLDLLTTGEYELIAKLRYPDNVETTTVVSFTYTEPVTSEPATTKIGTDKEEILDENDVTPPSLDFHANVEGNEITDSTDILATISDDKGILSYVLEYRLKGEADYTLLAKGKGAKADEKIGEIHPDCLLNGVYEFRLRVKDFGGNEVSGTREYGIYTPAKIGFLSLGFADFSKRIGGMNIQAERIYSNLVKTEGDFGYGWNLALGGMTLTAGGELWNGYAQGSAGTGLGTTFTIYETNCHDVVINFGDGTTKTFKVKLSPESQALRPIDSVNVGFRCVEDPSYTLSILGDDSAEFSDGLLYWNDESNYSGIRYLLTDKEGNKYTFNGSGKVETFEDTLGEVIYVSDAGFLNAEGKGIHFTRDEKNRITSVSDDFGKSVSYFYDGNGDLVTFVGADGIAVHYEYDHFHNLTTILDSEGRILAHSEYDKDGRLTASVDAEGNRISYEYDPALSMQRVTDRRGNSTVYYYDDFGQVVKSIDPYGNIALNEYDTNHNLIKRIDENGTEISYEYDDKGNVTKVTYPDGSTLQYSLQENGLIQNVTFMDLIVSALTYDSKGYINSSTDANGNVTEYTHDANGNVTSVSDAIGYSYQATYTEDGRLALLIDSNNNHISYTYNERGECISATITNGEKSHTVSMTYDSYGNISSATDNMGNTTLYEYDAKGNLLSVTDATGNKTIYRYSLNGNVEEIEYPDGSKETFEYDEEGNTIKATNRLGLSRTFAYDKLNRLISTTSPNGKTESYTYDAVGNLLSVTSVYGDVTTYEYDQMYRQTKVNSPLTGTTSYTYDMYSMLTSRTDAEGNTVSYEYDHNNNLTKVTYPDGAGCSYVYDARNRLVKEVDGYGNETKYSYTNSDLLSSVTDADGVSTQYSYDYMGNLTEVIDGNHHKTTYVYDDAFRLVEMRNAAAQSAHYVRNAAGRVLQYTDYAGHITEFLYDSCGNILSEKDAEKETLYYYHNGVTTGASDDNGRITYTYNELGQLATQTDASGNTLRFTYDTFGNVTKIEGLSVSENYTYDEFGRLKSAKNEQGEGVSYTYDALSRVKDALYTNGIKITYSYDSCGRVSEQVTVGPNGEILSSYTYTYGKNGEILTAMENYTLDGVVVQTAVQYTYGKSGMLLCETHTQGENVLKQTYSYDAAGNRTRKETAITGDVSRIANRPILAGITTYTYNEINQLIDETFTENANAANETVKKTTYTYDVAGNLVQTTGEKEAEYTYNNRNQLIKAKVTENGISGEETYGYDAQGVRAFKKNSTGETNYITYTIGGLSYLFAETDENGKLIASYLRGYGLVSETLYHNDSETENEETYFYLLDGNGDVRALANEAGNVTDTYRFDAFGIKLIQTGNTKNPYGYRSEETDELTGFVYLRARYMNPATGTFISEDTFGGVLSSPITLNRYAYAGQNPVSYMDPSGHFFTVIQQVLTLTLQEMIKDYEGTMAAGRLGAFISVMGAIVSGDSDLGWAYVKGYAMGVGTAGLGKLKELGQGILAAKKLYMVITLVRVFKNGSLAAYSLYKKDYVSAMFYGSLTVFGVFEYKSEAKALYQMNQTSVNNGDIKSHLYYNPDEDGSKIDFYAGKEGVATSLQEYDDFVGSVGNPVEVAGYGHTGRIIPNCLNEQMAMRQVRSNPLDGATELPFVMKDSRWSAEDGWVKMENNVYHSNGDHISIHFVYNKNTGMFDDFKFKDK